MKENNNIHEKLISLRFDFRRASNSEGFGKGHCLSESNTQQQPAQKGHLQPVQSPELKVFIKYLRIKREHIVNDLF